ncbi:MAG: hypothetical protein QNJ97_11485 [Myxococcota bacterium]|nr:hypothetical protein [Myxococcota bacterium]
MKRRDAELSCLGLNVLKFSSLDVHTNMDGEIATVIQYLEAVLVAGHTDSKGNLERLTLNASNPRAWEKSRRWLLTVPKKAVRRIAVSKY